MAVDVSQVSETDELTTMLIIHSDMHFIKQEENTLLYGACNLEVSVEMVASRSLTGEVPRRHHWNSSGCKDTNES